MYFLLHVSQLSLYSQYTLYAEPYMIHSFHSSLGYVPQQSNQQYPQHSSSFPVGPTHQPTHPQPSHPGYPPPQYQYPPHQGYYYGHPPPPQLPPTSSPHPSSLLAYHYTGARVQQPSYQGNICCSTVVLHV